MGVGEVREKPLAPFMGVLQKGSPSLPQVLALPSPIKDPPHEQNAGARNRNCLFYTSCILCVLSFYSADRNTFCRSRPAFFVPFEVGLVRDRERAVFPFLRNGAVLSIIFAGISFFAMNSVAGQTASDAYGSFHTVHHNASGGYHGKTHCPRDRQRRGHALLQHVFHPS